MQETADLRELLLETIAGVKAGEIAPEQGQAVAALSNSLISHGRLELDVLKMAVSAGGKIGRVVSPRLIGNVTIETEDGARADPPTNGSKPTPAIEKPKAAPPEQEEWLKLAKQTLKKDQPLDLEEFSLITKIPQAKLFKLLSDESVFERDTDSMYWLAK